MRNIIQYSILGTALVFSGSIAALAQESISEQAVAETATDADLVDAAAQVTEAPTPSEAVEAVRQIITDPAAAPVAETTPVDPMPPVAPATQIAIAPEACELYVYTSPSVTGVTKGSPLLGALGELAKGAAGSLATKYTGNFQAGQMFGNSVNNFADSNAAARIGDVPLSIAEHYAPARQANIIQGLSMENNLGKASTQPIFDGKPLFKKDEVEAHFETSTQDCLNVLTIENITFEHSKTYDRRLALIVETEIKYFKNRKRSPSKRVKFDHEVKLEEVKLDPEGKILNPEVAEQALNSAYQQAIELTLEKYRKKVN